MYESSQLYYCKSMADPGEGPREPGSPPSPSDQTEAQMQRAAKGRAGNLPYLWVWITRPPPYLRFGSATGNYSYLYEQVTYQYSTNICTQDILVHCTSLVCKTNRKKFPLSDQFHFVRTTEPGYHHSTIATSNTIGY